MTKDVAEKEFLKRMIAQKHPDRDEVFRLIMAGAYFWIEDGKLRIHADMTVDGAQMVHPKTYRGANARYSRATRE